MDAWMTVRDVSRLLGLSPSTVYRHARTGYLPSHKPRFGLRFKEAEIQDFLDRHKRRALRLRNLQNQLTSQLQTLIDIAKGGNSSLARKKGQTCFNFGFGRIYLRTYKSGRSTWTIGYRDENGKRVQQAVPEAQSRGEAVFALQRKIQEVFDRKFGVEKRRGNVGFKTFARSFLDDYMMTTRRNFQSDVYRLNKLCGYFKDADLRTITPLAVERFRKSKLIEGIKKSSCNRYLALMRRMYNVAIEEGYAEENPVAKVKLFSEKDTLKERILTAEEEKRLLAVCSERLRSIVKIALNTGMRVSEILSLRWTQVDLEKRSIRVERTKSGKIRFIPINSALFDELRRLKSNDSQGFHVFLNRLTAKPFTEVRRAFVRTCKKAGVEGLRFHDLRHTFASRLVHLGADVETLRELLGHRDITTTQRYLHSTNERRRQAVELLSKKDERKICDVAVTQVPESKLIN